MEASIAPLVQLYKFPVGRARFALQAVAERARVLGINIVAEVAQRGADEVQQVINLIARFDSGSSGMYPPEAGEFDYLLDHCLGGVLGYVEAQMRAYMGEPRAEAAGRLLTVAFPNGLAAITHLAYAEQHAQVSAMLARLRAPDMADDVAALPELAALLARAQLLNESYGDALRSTDQPTRAQVRAGRARVQEVVCEVLCAVIGHFPLQDTDPGTERAQLLEPILEQNRAIRVARRRRRGSIDIDPETGEELPDPDADGQADPQAPTEPVAVAVAL